MLKEDAKRIASNLPSEKKNSSAVKSLPVVENSKIASNSPVASIPSVPHQKTQIVNGSGCVEKACDTVIGNRHSSQGMSWGKKGSRSLGILKVEELNKRWD